MKHKTHVFSPFFVSVAGFHRLQRLKSVTKDSLSKPWYKTKCQGEINTWTSCFDSITHLADFDFDFVWKVTNLSKCVRSRNKSAQNQYQQGEMGRGGSDSWGGVTDFRRGVKSAWGHNWFTSSANKNEVKIYRLSVCKGIILGRCLAEANQAHHFDYTDIAHKYWWRKK